MNTNEIEIICTAVLESLKRMLAENKKITDVLVDVTNMSVPDEMFTAIADTLERHSRQIEIDFPNHLEKMGQAIQVCKSAGIW